MFIYRVQRTEIEGSNSHARSPSTWDLCMTLIGDGRISGIWYVVLERSIVYSPWLSWKTHFYIYQQHTWLDRRFALRFDLTSDHTSLSLNGPPVHDTSWQEMSWHTRFYEILALLSLDSIRSVCVYQSREFLVCLSRQPLVYIMIKAIFRENGKGGAWWGHINGCGARCMVHLHAPLW